LVMFERLSGHLNDQGVSCDITQSDAPGSAMHIAGTSVAVICRSLPDVPERLLEVLSLHILRGASSQGAGTLMLIVVPRLPRAKDDWSGDIRSAQKRLRSRAPWAIISHRGGCLACLPAHKRRLIVVPDRHVDAHSSQDALATHEVSSDVALAVLKSMVLSKTPGGARLQGQRTHGNGFHSGPGAPDTLMSLARRLGVSRASVYNAIGEFVRNGWVRAQRGQLPVIRAPADMLNWWLDKRRHHQSRRIAVAPLYETPPTRRTHILDWLRNHYKASDVAFALTGWSACALHRRLVVNDIGSKPITISVRDSIGSAMSTWSLREVADDRAFLHLQKSPHPLTTFSWLHDIDGLPVVDLWEAAIDVVSDPQRGFEQACAIRDDVFLAP